MGGRGGRVERDEGSARGDGGRGDGERETHRGAALSGWFICWQEEFFLPIRWGSKGWERVWEGSERQGKLAGVAHAPCVRASLEARDPGPDSGPLLSLADCHVCKVAGQGNLPSASASTGKSLSLFSRCRHEARCAETRETTLHTRIHLNNPTNTPAHASLTPTRNGSHSEREAESNGPGRGAGGSTVRDHN